MVERVLVFGRDADGSNGDGPRFTAVLVDPNSAEAQELPMRQREGARDPARPSGRYSASCRSARAAAWGCHPKRCVPTRQLAPMEPGPAALEAGQIADEGFEVVKVKLGDGDLEYPGTPKDGRYAAPPDPGTGMRWNERALLRLGVSEV